MPKSVIRFPDIPDRITRDQINEVCRVLGMDINHLRSIHLERDCAEFEVMPHTDSGAHFAVRDQLSTVVVRVPVADGHWQRSAIVDQVPLSAS